MKYLVSVVAEFEIDTEDDPDEHPLITAIAELVAGQDNGTFCAAIERP